MRDSLTALAIVLIVLLTAALVAPYFVDWNAQRAFVEARLSHALGEKVTIGGNIDLKILPTPYMVLDQVVIGADDGPIRLGIRHLDLELTIAPLLHGEFEVVEARLQEPTIRVTLTSERNLPSLPDAPAFKADIRFDRISVVGGTLAIADPLSGRTFALERLDLEAEAASLAGPFKGSGSTGAPDARTKFRFATTSAPSGKTRTKLLIEATARHMGLDLDGIFALAKAPDQSTRQTFDGTAALSGHRALGRTDLPWHLSGPVHMDPRRITLGLGELRVGEEDRSLFLAATGDAVLTEAPTLQMSLSGKQIDIDRLFGGGLSAGGGLSQPDLPDLAALSQAFDTVSAPVPMTVDLSVDAATYGGDTISGLQGSFVLGASGPSPLRIKVAGPGRSRLSVEGVVKQTAPSFEGSVSAMADDLPQLAAWLATAVPGSPHLPKDVSVRSAEAKGAITIAEGGIEAHGFTLRLDKSALRGAAAFHPATSAGRALLQAGLKADVLDFDALPDLDHLRSATTGLDLDIKLDARTVDVNRLGVAGAGHVSLGLAKTGSRIVLDPLKIEGLGGATIDATAHLDGDAGRLDARLNAARLVEVIGLARRLYPGRVTDALAARATSLSPAKLTVSAVLPGQGGATTAASTAVTIAGSLGGTTLDATFAPDPTAPGSIIGKAGLASKDAAHLLAQLGAAVLPLDNLGAGSVTLTARGPVEGPLSTTAHGAFGSTTLDVTGQLDQALSVPTGSGTLRLASPDVSPLVQALGLAFPDLLGRIDVAASSGVALSSTALSFADIKGCVADATIGGSLLWRRDAKDDEPALTGSLLLDRLSLDTLVALSLGPAQQHGSGASWSNLAFGTGLIDPPRSRLDLKAKVFDLVPGVTGHDATMTLDVSPGLVALTKVAAGLDPGRLTGAVTLRRDGATAAVEGRLGLSDAALDLPSATGRVTATIDWAGSGTSALALIGSLAGTGQATIADLHIPGADPGALPRVFDDIEADRLAIDEDSIIRALGAAQQAPLDAGTRFFTLSLATGVLHADPKPAGGDKGPVTSTATATIDLRTLSVDQRVEQTLRALPRDWLGAPPRVVVLTAGPLKAPGREVDIGGFLNALAARALARETARLEVYEFDIHERAFFNARLQADRRREQDRVKAEEDARQAAEAVRRAEAEQRAREKAERDRAERDRAERDRAERDRAERDRAAHERALREPLPLNGAIPRSQTDGDINPPPEGSRP